MPQHSAAVRLKGVEIPLFYFADFANFAICSFSLRRKHDKCHTLLKNLLNIL